MEGLETPYEVEVPIDFIDCVSCVKSIRSETLYKIHLTTIGHMKKEDALVASGFPVRNHVVPDFEDIMQYLQYLNLDEPIIGLSYLEEVVGSDTSDPQPGPRYTCRLCSLEANLPNMINHIIGRKHRQKYLMTQRKDLVTWDHSTSFNQPAKVIRAKAEVVERQDGRGTPKPLRRNQGKSNIMRVSQKQRHKKAPHNAGYHVPGYPGQERQPGHYPQHEGQPLPFHPGDHYLGPEEEGRGHQQSRNLHCSPELEVYMENDHDRREFMDSDCHQDYPEGPMGGGYRDQMPGFAEEMHHREASPYRRPYPENDPLKQFYTEELRRERARANDAAAGTAGRMSYPSPDPQDTHAGGAGGRTYAYPPGGAERHHPDGSPQGGPRHHRPYQSGCFNDETRRGMLAPEESYHGAGYPDQDHHGDPEPRRNSDQPLDRDYLFEMVGALRNRKAGPPRSAAAAPYQGPEGGRGMAEIPETFRRFLQGGGSSQETRKRKSRFSDATQEEVEGSKRMLMESDRFATFEEAGPSRHGMSRGRQRADLQPKSQSPYQNESYPEREVENAKDSGKVFDLLKNIEIQNGEEADFLKSRLCNLLKEFQAKKSEKTLQNRPDSAPISRDYHHRSQARPAPLPPPAPSPPPAQPGRGAFREGVQWRPKENHPRSSQDPRGWEEQEQQEQEQEQGGPPDERFQEHQHPVHSDSNGSSRQRYEEVFGVRKHRAPDGAQPRGRFQDQGRSFQDQGRSFQDQGRSFHDQGRSFQDQGRSFQDQGRSFQDQGRSFQDQGRSFQDRGRSFQDQGRGCDYPPASPEFLGGGSASPSSHRDPERPRGRQHSSLDKITSTLLELVARK